MFLRRATSYVQEKFNISSFETLWRNLNTRPTLVIAEIDTSYEDSVFVLPISVFDPDLAWGDSISVTVENVPKWLRLDPSTKFLSGVPRGEDVGSVSFRIRVVDVVGGETSANVTITVKHVNHPPVFKSVPDTVAFEDSLYTYWLVGEDVDQALFRDTLSFVPVVLPSWIHFDVSTNRLFGTPSAFNVGDTLVVVSLTDNLGAITMQEFNLHVYHRNHAPTFVTQPNVSAVEGELYWYDILVFDPDTLFHDNVRLLLDIAPDWMTFSSGRTLISGIPPVGGPHEVFVRLKAEDSYSASTTQEFDIHIVPRSVRTDTTIVLPADDFDVRPSAFRPVKFIWPSSHGAKAYFVEIFSSDSEYAIITQDTTLAFANAKLFKSGEFYTWYVSALHDSFSVGRVDTFGFTVGAVMVGEMNISTGVPREFSMFQNYPNPFNPTTSIVYGVPEVSIVTFEVFDMLGRMVYSEHFGEKPVGYHVVRWDGKGWGGIVSSGVYVYRISATTKDGTTVAKSNRMIFLR